ncbi:MAG TPA: hypothetical protein VK444_02860 [Methanobacteriaceae archaeon]|nr:hypothetical protein [Methanobacteriaceae archaeon]
MIFDANIKTARSATVLINRVNGSPDLKKYNKSRINKKICPNKIFLSLII